jgi:hypothetical protein
MHVVTPGRASSRAAEIGPSHMLHFFVGCGFGFFDRAIVVLTLKTAF